MWLSIVVYVFDLLELTGIHVVELVSLVIDLAVVKLVVGLGVRLGFEAKTIDSLFLLSHFGHDFILSRWSSILWSRNIVISTCMEQIFPRLSNKIHTFPSLPSLNPSFPDPWVIPPLPSSKLCIILFEIPFSLLAASENVEHPRHPPCNSSFYRQQCDLSHPYRHERFVSTLYTEQYHYLPAFYCSFFFSSICFWYLFFTLNAAVSVCLNFSLFFFSSYMTSPGYALILLIGLPLLS